MRAVVAAIVFVVTLGTIYWFDNHKNLDTPQLSRDVSVQALVMENIQNTSLPTAKLVQTQITTSTSKSAIPLPPATHIPTPIVITSSPIPQNINSPTPTPSPTGSRPAATGTPSPTGPSTSSGPSAQSSATQPSQSFGGQADTPSTTPMPDQSQKININTANLEKLDEITGIGPAYAKNIIDYRTANGSFKKIEDIINVKGIGEKTFQKMKDEITVGNPR